MNFYYAMTMWAIATGNSELEGLGRLQTRMVARSINEYFLLKDSNTNHPADFVRNKVRLAWPLEWDGAGRGCAVRTMYPTLRRLYRYIVGSKTLCHQVRGSAARRLKIFQTRKEHRSSREMTLARKVAGATIPTHTRTSAQL